MPENVLVFGCSGASDVGEIADRAARTLARSDAAEAWHPLQSDIATVP